MHDAIRRGLLVAVTSGACAALWAGKGGAKQSTAKPSAAWHPLFDGGANGTGVNGTSVNEFRGWISGVLPHGWHVVDGALVKDGPVEDLLTREVYGNFELELDWKIGKEGNSGVLYRGTREYEHLYWSAPEYPLLDDANAPDRSPLASTASVNGLYAAPAGVVKAFGEWNTTRIVVDGTRVEHWLNGRKAVTYELGSADWKAKVAASKFSKYPGYGMSKRGFVGIEGDHRGSLALRRVRIRELT